MLPTWPCPRSPEIRCVHTCRGRPSQDIDYGISRVNKNTRSAHFAEQKMNIWIIYSFNAATGAP
eukprot:1594979-Pyramimonas_sp.AAC.1